MKDDPISVALIEPVGGRGGMDAYDLGLCRGLIAAGCQVSYYTCDETVLKNTPGLRFYPLLVEFMGQVILSSGRLVMLLAP